jgi:hypothetical protein
MQRRKDALSKMSTMWPAGPTSRCRCKLSCLPFQVEHELQLTLPQFRPKKTAWQRHDEAERNRDGLIWRQRNCAINCCRNRILSHQCGDRPGIWPGGDRASQLRQAKGSMRSLPLSASNSALCPKCRVPVATFRHTHAAPSKYRTFSIAWPCTVWTRRSEY